MASIIYIDFWEDEFDNIVSKTYKVQHITLKELKLDVRDIFKEDEKITKKFEPSNDEDLINKANLDKNLIKMFGKLWFSARKITTDLNYTTANNL